MPQSRQIIEAKQETVVVNISDLRKTARDMRDTLVAVNREVAGIDGFFVAWTWITWIFNELKTLGLFVGGSVIIELFAKQAVTPAMVLDGLAAYALYMVLNSSLSTLYFERRQIFELNLNTRIQQQKTEHIATLDLGRIVDPEFRELLNMFESRGSRSVWALWHSQLEFVASGAALVTGAAVLLHLDWVLGVLAILIAAPNVAERWLGAQRRRAIQEAETLTRRRRFEIFDALVQPDTAVLMRLLRYTSSLLARYGSLTQIMIANLRAIIRYERTLTIWSASITFLSVMNFGIYFALQLKEHEYTFTELGAIIGSFQVLSNSIRGFGWAIAGIDQERRDFDYLRRLLQTKPLVDETGFVPIKLDRTPRLELHDVLFAYPGVSGQAVRNCSVTIDPGEKVALVGPNGSGKTTLLRLMSRIYLPTSGQVRIAGQLLNRIRQDSWLAYHVMLTQGSKLPGVEIEYAVTGAEHDHVDQGRLWQALHASKADEFVRMLPLQERTCIGEEWPDGRGFSTGQRQRLILAAALYRLLGNETFVASFDEPTANCDAETKETFYETITKSASFSTKTIVVALHDPIYLHLFDRVLLFENGMIVEDLRGIDRITQYRDRIINALSRDL